MTGVAARGGQRQQEVAARIKDYILRHRLGPGDPLPTEAELCEAVSASRSSVREAVKTLTALDIVEVRHGHGTYVGKMSLAALVESLAFRGLLSRSDDHKVLSELVDVRQMLEQGLAGAIIAAMNPELHESLADLAAEMLELAHAGKPFIEQDRAFHLMLLEPLGNELVIQLTAAFWDVHALIAPSLGTRTADAVLTAEAHLAIVAAARQDVDALIDAFARHYAPVRERIAAAVGS